MIALADDAACSVAFDAAEELLAMAADDPELDTVLYELSRQFDELNKRTGSLEALNHALRYARLALELRPPGRSYRSDVQWQLADLHHRRFTASHQLGDLEDSCQHYERVIMENPQHRHRVLWIHCLAELRAQQPLLDDNTTALDTAISLNRDLLPFYHWDPRSRHIVCQDLKCLLAVRAQRLQNLHDLDASILLHEECLLFLIPHEHPTYDLVIEGLTERWRQDHRLSERLVQTIRGALVDGSVAEGISSTLDGLQHLLYLRTDIIHCPRETVDEFDENTRTLFFVSLLQCLVAGFRNTFILTGKTCIVERALVLCKTGLRLEVSEVHHRVLLLQELCLWLCTKHDSTGELSVLEEGIGVLHDALGLHTEHDADRGSLVALLSTSLTRRFMKTGDITSLVHAHLAGEEALTLLPDGHFQRPTTLRHQAVITSLAFQEGVGRNLGLDQAIRRVEEALTYHDDDANEQVLDFNTLGWCFALRHEQTSDLGDLDNSIRFYRESLARMHDNHQHSASGITCIGHQLALKGTHESLQEAVCLYRRALDLCGPDDPARMLALQGLGRTLIQLGYDTFHEGVLHALDALRHKFGTPKGRLRGGADCLAVIYGIEHAPEQEKLAACIEIRAAMIDLLPQVAFMGSDVSARLIGLGEWEQLGTIAASEALLLDQTSRAMEMLEAARATFWSQALRLRSPLNDEGDADLARLKFLLTTLDESNTSSLTKFEGNSLAVNTSWTQSHIETSLRIAYSDEAEQLLSRLRERPGFERLLRGPTISALAQVASRGPVVVLVSSGMRCHAVVFAGPHDKPLHVPLKVDPRELETYSFYVQSSDLRLYDDAIDAGHLERKTNTTRRFNEQSDSHRLLAALWRKVVQVIVETLGLPVSVPLAKVP